MFKNLLKWLFEEEYVRVIYFFIIIAVIISSNLELYRVISHETGFTIIISSLALSACLGLLRHIWFWFFI
jgi:hypothetical protein